MAEDIKSPKELLDEWLSPEVIARYPAHQRDKARADAQRRYQALALVDASQGDLGHWIQACVADGKSQFNRRAYVRALAAHVETTLHVYCDEVAQAAADPAVVMVANETQVRLLENGDVTLDGLKAPLKGRLRFAFRQYAAVNKATFELPVKEKGWQQLLDAIAIRDRITHPKSSKGIEIADDELTDVQDAALWFTQQCGELMRRSLERFNLAPR